MLGFMNLFTAMPLRHLWRPRDGAISN